MYRLTPTMLQRFGQDLRKYHTLLSSRCSGWNLEELIAAAIDSDTVGKGNVTWMGAKHDDDADIKVRTNGAIYALKIKSGKMTREHLVLSGYRLGRFDGNMKKIANYLNSKHANIITIPYKKIIDSNWRKHFYQVSYIDADILTNLSQKAWIKEGKKHVQTNKHGVVVSIRPTMSWQVWWKIPLRHVTQEKSIELKQRLSLL